MMGDGQDDQLVRVEAVVDGEGESPQDAFVPDLERGQRDGDAAMSSIAARTARRKSSPLPGRSSL